MNSIKSASDLIELFTAHWTTAILASGVEYDVFAHVERGSTSVESLSQKTGLSARSLQALLDGLVGIGALVATNGRYANSAAASAHLVRGKPGYVGGYARIVMGAADGGMRQWSRLPEALRLGRPIEPETIVDPDSPFWQELVMALLPLSCEVAARAAERLDLAARRQVSILDVGGGAGAYALVWLARNPTSSLTQIDWAKVNAVARSNLESKGLGGRFQTRDGDFHQLPFGEGEHEIVIFSNIFHHESPPSICTLLQKAFTALRPSGQVLISDFMLNDDRAGPSFAARFSAGMVLQTPEGSSYRAKDYREWLKRAGFELGFVDRSHPISTLVVGQKRGGRGISGPAARSASRS